MSALQYPVDYAEAARDFLAVYATDPQVSLVTEEEGAPVRAWAATIDDTLNEPGRRVALRSWLTYLHTEHGPNVHVETLQARFGTRDFDDAVSGVWIPGARQFIRYASSVQFFVAADSPHNFSTRYFSGLKAVAASETVWVGFSPDARTVIVYRVTGLEG